MSKRRDQRQLERLRAGFWSSEPSMPAQVPDTFEARATYERESLSLQILEGVQDYMAHQGITQHALADSLGISEGRVSQILSGEQNLTLRTLASVAAGLKGHFEIRLQPATGGTWESAPSPDQDPTTATPPTDPTNAPPAPVPAREMVSS
jgi:predicted XRE-type DNA-binding protein